MRTIVGIEHKTADRCIQHSSAEEVFLESTFYSAGDMCIGEGIEFLEIFLE